MAINLNEPLTLDALVRNGVLDGFTPPAGSFDPSGAWRNTYRIWLNGKDDINTFSITRNPSSDSPSIILNQETRVTQASDSFLYTAAEITGADDALCTPQSWYFRSVALDIAGQPYAQGRVAETGTVSGSTIQINTGTQIFERDAPTTFTSDWSLFDAVQRLPGTATSPIDFDLLEGLDALKAGCRLAYYQSLDLDVNGHIIPLTGYNLIGPGLLPWEFWIDSAGRLLFALTGIRAYLLQSSANGHFFERWNEADMPQTFSGTSSDGVSGADNTWAFTIGANAGTTQITEGFPAGNKRLEMTTEGGSDFNTAEFFSDIDPVTLAADTSVVLETTMTFGSVGTEANRNTWLYVHDGEVDASGYGIIFKSKLDAKPLVLYVVLNGVRTSVSVGVAGVQETGIPYTITAVFRKSGADTIADYQVLDSDGVLVVPAGSATITGAALGTGLVLNKANVTFSRRSLCAVDDIIVFG